MIGIYPNLNKLSEIYTCPKCKSELSMSNFIINGMRNLIDVSCKSCNGEFLIDLPTNFGLYYPTILNKKTFEIIDPCNVEWFHSLLLKSYQSQNNEDIKIKHEIRKNKNEAILINCLDFIYGHSLFKLFNTQWYLDRFSQYGICLLIPKQISHLVPDGVDEILEVDMPFKKYKEWFNSLNTKIHSFVKTKKKCYLAITFPQINHQLYDLERFNKDIIKLPRPIKMNDTKKTIIFLYRENRKWGRFLFEQKRNIEKLFQYLKKYYSNLDFAVIGIGKKIKFNKDIRDLRTEKFNLDLENKWIEEYQKADCLIGVHGSHMILPSGLAKNIIALLPENRYSNFLQDIILDKNDSLINNLYAYRTIYGNNYLSDISPKRIFKILTKQVDGFERFTDYMNLRYEQHFDNLEDYLKITDYFKKYKCKSAGKTNRFGRLLKLLTNKNF